MPFKQCFYYSRDLHSLYFSDFIVVKSLCCSSKLVRLYRDQHLTILQRWFYLNRQWVGLKLKLIHHSCDGLNIFNRVRKQEDSLIILFLISFLQLHCSQIHTLTEDSYFTDSFKETYYSTISSNLTHSSSPTNKITLH